MNRKLKVIPICIVSCALISACGTGDYVNLETIEVTLPDTVTSPATKENIENTKTSSTESIIDTGGNAIDREIKDGETYAAFKFKGIKNEVIVKLYPEYAPLAVENFKKLVEKKYYKNKIISRINKDHSFEGGVVNKDYVFINSGEEDYEVERPHEMRNFYGALAMSNGGISFDDPQSALNGGQFYFVTNKKENAFDDYFSDAYLKIQISVLQAQQSMMEDKDDEDSYTYFRNQYIWFNRIGQYSYETSLNPTAKNVYNKLGGLPVYDGANTVFGQTVSGFEVIDYINYLPTLKDGDDNYTIPEELLVIENVYLRVWGEE